MTTKSSNGLVYLKKKIIQRYPGKRKGTSVCGTWGKIQINSEGKFLG